MRRHFAYAPTETMALHQQLDAVAEAALRLDWNLRNDPARKKAETIAGIVRRNTGLMAINYGRKFFKRVLIFRPHNVYGPDMGWEHVIPQLALRLNSAAKAHPSGKLTLEIQGTGKETRSFCFIDDLVAGVMTMREKGEHFGIYHIGTTEEVTIADLARRIAAISGREIELTAGKPATGGTARRCPDISNLARQL